MSNQQIEIPERQLVVRAKHSVSKGCLITLIIAILICTAPISLPKLTTLVNQIKWHASGLIDYYIYVTAVGYAVWPDNLGSAILTGQDLKGPYPTKISVDEVFLLAYECFVFCSVNYDLIYGYPTQITKGFIEGGSLLISVKPNTP